VYKPEEKNNQNIEKAWIVGINFPDKQVAAERRASSSIGKNEINNHLDELSSLLKTFGVETTGRTVVSIKKPSPAFIIGKGKVEEIISNADDSDSSLIVFDDDLSPSQQKNWEKLSKKRVIDRSEVIINIFAERAKTKEASLQVELAYCKYMLPRLTGAWKHLSRQRGGHYGTKGSGEKQIETDRRTLQKRIAVLKKELDIIEKQRHTRRKLRENREVFSCSIAGYTNAGKSTLLNRLTGANVSTNNRLFDTLDPVTRKLYLPAATRTLHSAPQHGHCDEALTGKEIVITDTVGFIRKLPHQLIEAFKSTLEETVFADLVILLLDASSSEVKSHYQTSMEVLKEIGVDKEKIMIVFNKADIPQEPGSSPAIPLFEQENSDPLFVSALDGANIDKFILEIKKRAEAAGEPGAIIQF
jgi:GTP-binding protein HflX